MTESAEYQSTEARPAPWAGIPGLAAAMLERLEECRREREDPPVEAVHRLRTGTRRLEAALDLVARQAGARGLPAEVESARQRWLRQLKKIRRAAGAVRDLDVHRGLIAATYQPEGPEPRSARRGRSRAGSGAASDPDPEVRPDLNSDLHPELHPDLLKEAGALEIWLIRQRRAAAAEMVRMLDRRVVRLLVAGEEFLAALARRPARRRAPRSTVTLALEDVMRLIDGMPLIDRENLHDFRKGAKKARYIFESEPEDPKAQALARTLRRAQDAIGQWHDWDVLAEEAAKALGARSPLVADLRRRERESYARALRIAHSASRRLVGEWQALHPRRRAR